MLSRGRRPDTVSTSRPASRDAEKAHPGGCQFTGLSFVGACTSSVPSRRRTTGRGATSEASVILAGGRRSAGDTAARFPRLTQPAVSRHLKVLRDAGLVNVEVNAQQRIYTIRSEGLADLYAWVAKHQAMWPDTLDALERYLDAKALADERRRKGSR